MCSTVIKEYTHSFNDFIENMAYHPTRGFRELGDCQIIQEDGSMMQKTLWSREQKKGFYGAYDLTKSCLLLFSSSALIKRS